MQTSQSIEAKKNRIDSLGRAYATGKRKTAVARVWLKPGSGKITINKKDCADYFRMPSLLCELHMPFETIGKDAAFDVFASAKGGGLSAQVGALRLGISRALSFYDPEMRKALKQAKLLTRDSRIVERKKYGHKKARKSFQYSKR